VLWCFFFAIRKPCPLEVCPARMDKNMHAVVSLAVYAGVTPFHSMPFGAV